MIPGNSHLMKMFSPEQLHKLIVKERYDIEVAYLEGPCARVISGCSDPTVKKLAWIHIEQHTTERAAVSFRNVSDAKACYRRFDSIICVSQTVKQDFYGCCRFLCLMRCCITPMRVIKSFNFHRKRWIRNDGYR